VNVTQVTNVYNTYHVTNTTVNNVTVNNVTVNRINYTYANNAAAVTAVSRETFVGAKPVQASPYASHLNNFRVCTSSKPRLLHLRAPATSPRRPA
jgi:hypothetical protein